MLKALSNYILLLRCKLSVGSGSYFRFTIKPCDSFFIVGISAQYRILSLNCDNGGWVGLGIQRNESIFRDILLYISPRVTTQLNVSPDLMKTLVFVEFLPCCQAAPQSSGYSLYLFNCHLFLLSVSSMFVAEVATLSIMT